MRGLLFTVVFATSLVFAAGCGRSAPMAPTAPAGPTPPTEATLTDGGVADIDRAAKDTKDAVFLVEFWTMASEPPPDFALAANSRAGDNQARAAPVGKDKVAWHGVRKAEYLGAKYGGHFLRVILVNVDGPEKRGEVLKFLKDRDARHVTNLAWKDGPTADRYGFTGKAPHQAVFGRNGNRVWATGEPLAGTFDGLLFQELDK
ncbi:hypothetical protein J8F10_05965 [Gemmata sp. G18]|uniref:Uncharacterized protein n=1 Tax=Gemmata palustris TaxID=2822762 RepID=A0ABS5BM94_9BACT|nr:hypothetical protein [Gemmata palustris]MBP3954827.1 hypothetical protein [Gemmata palustris]